MIKNLKSIRNKVATFYVFTRASIYDYSTSKFYGSKSPIVKSIWGRIARLSD